jgi:hypothetical protein
VAVAVSQPSVATLLQSAKPVAQAITPQRPVAHVPVALGGAHARPHAPQWASVVPRSVSQPFAAIPSQSPKPGSQRTIAHAPAVQACVATCARLQRVPHIPQFAGSWAVLAQKSPVRPSVAVVSVQRVRGMAQVVVQVPFEQT